jgi:xanthine dehydrogenase small subunit
MHDPIHFVLNDREVRATEPPGMPVLDFLRRRRDLTGTKEGCREGDCGACVVLVGDFDGEKVRYKAVTSCLMPLGELHGKHLATIEGLNQERLTPPQQAIANEGATQCGFCTPGIVVSLTGYLIDRRSAIDPASIKEVLGGHLCRCTGYRSLKAVSEHLDESVGTAAGVQELVDIDVLPEHFLRAPDILKSIKPRVHPDGTEKNGHVVAGGTDIYVQRGDAITDGTVSLLNTQHIPADIEESDAYVDVGALTTFEDFARSPSVQRIIPDIGRYMHLVASLQIRNRATLGGNIINASPIGDMTILFLALNAELILQRGSSSRMVPMSRFYLGYKEMDLQRGEVLARIRIPRLGPRTHIHWEKVSKRTCLDIASVNMAMKVEVSGSQSEPARGSQDLFDRDLKIESATIAAGGVAPVPLLLRETATYLTNRAVSVETMLKAAAIAQSEISPIDDIRGSATYKRLLVRQLLIGQFAHLFPENISVEDCYAAH